ncbi:MAG: VPLPA-CTERM sorting domain-containing protein [Spongiibacteraceae bacterium]
MKAIKSLLAVSVLAAAGAASATTWNITASGSNYFPGVGGYLNSTGFVGTWDDVSGAGAWSGRVASAGTVALDVNFNQTFVMPTSISGPDSQGYLHQGTLNPFDIPTCHDNVTGQNGGASSSCAGFSGPLSGEFFNTVAGNANGNNVNNYNLATPVAFTPVDGATYHWTLQIYKATGKTLTFLPLVLDVTLHAQPTPEVPVPAAAWLFGSGLLGLAGTARRRRSA